MIVRTAAGLDALPASTVVLDNDGDAWQKDEHTQRWWCVGTSEDRPVDRVVRYGPFRTMRVINDITITITPGPPPEDIGAAAARGLEAAHREGWIG